MNPSIILDAHLDIALNKIALGRDFRKSSWESSASNANSPVTPMTTSVLPLSECRI